MADLKLGSQIGGNLIWHQGVLELNPLDESLFYKQFDIITSKGGQTIDGGINLKGNVETTGKFYGVGNDVPWAQSPDAVLNMDKNNTGGAHWLIASRKADGSPRSGIQVRTDDSGETRIYTNRNVNYTAFRDGQVFIQATTPSNAANATRKDYVDKEVDRAMQFAETTTDKLTADLATTNTRINTLDAQNVKLTGDQTISGVKRFNSHIFVPAADPTLDTQLTHKSYVDKKVGTAVQEITVTSPLTTTGGVRPALAITPATRSAAGSMSSQDKVKLDDLPADALSRSGGNMKNAGYINLEGVGGIQSLYNGKTYSILRDHNNGNVTIGAASGDLYLGYNTTNEIYTTNKVLLHQTMRWKDSAGRILVDTDGFIPWESVKDRVGLESKSKNLVGGINFDSYESTGFYNLYGVRPTTGTLSVNPPPMDYGTLIVVGSDKDAKTFVTQIATNKTNGVMFVRTRNDGTMAWTDWESHSPKSYGLGTISGVSLSSSQSLQDCNDITLTGFYSVYEGTTNTPLGTGPSGSSLIHQSWGSEAATQTFIMYTDDRTFFRRKRSGVWQPWVEIITTNRARFNTNPVIENNAPQLFFTEKDSSDKRWVFAADGGTFRLHEDSTDITDATVVMMVDTVKNTTIRNPVSRSAQGTLANSLVRKDYVDAIDAKNVAKAGDTMTGALTSPQFKASGDYGFVRSTNIGQGMFVGADGRTIIGGGTGAVSVRPQGIGVIPGETVFNNDGTITLYKEGTASNHLVSKAYVDKNVSKAGDTMTGNLTILHPTPAIVFSESDATGGPKNFIFVSDGGGIRLNEDSSIGRYVWNYNKSNDAIALYKPETGEGGMGTKSTSLTTKAYVDAIDSKNVAKAGDTMTGVLNMKSGQAGAANFAGGASAVFTNNTTNAWFHINRQTGVGHEGLAISDGVAPNSTNPIAVFQADSVITRRATYISSGQLQIKTDGNPVLEFHVPGKHARLIWTDNTTGDLNFSSSHGSFTEVTRYMTLRGDSTGLSIQGANWANAGSHAYADQWTRQAPLNVNFGAVNGTSDYYQIVKGRSVASGAGYTTDVEFGTLRSGNTWGQGIIRVGSGESATKATQAIFQFGITGNFVAPGAIYGSGAGVHDNGQRVYSAVNPPPAAGHNHLNIRARGQITLWSGDITSGNFALNQPWTNFDMILFVVAWDNNECFTSKTFTRYDLEYMQGLAVNYDISGGAGGVEWYGRFSADNRTFVTYKENSRMRKVIGYNLQTVN